MHKGEVMSLLKKKKDKLNEEQNSVAKDGIKELVDDLAVEEDFFIQKLKRSSNIYPEKIENKYNTLFRLITKDIKNMEFKKKLISRILFVKDYGSICFLENGLKGNVDNYLFEARFFSNEIVFTSQMSDKIDQGKIICKQNKTCIHYSTTVEQIKPMKYFECFAKEFKEENKFQLLDTHKVERISLYNHKDVEILNFTKERNNSYYYNPMSFFKLLKEPTEGENYTKRTYIFRDKEYVIKHTSFLYDLPNAPKGKYVPMANLENKEQYFIARDKKPFSLNIPYDLDYIPINRNSFESYKENVTIVEDIYNASKCFVKKREK